MPCTQREVWPADRPQRVESKSAEKWPSLARRAWVRRLRKVAPREVRSAYVSGIEVCMAVTSEDSRARGDQSRGHE